jgi:hypothetical protein
MSSHGSTKKLNIWKHNKLQNNTASKERYTIDMDAGSTNCIENFEESICKQGALIKGNHMQHM